MSNCKYCNKEFELMSFPERGNHVRWCDKNPKRNDWNSKNRWKNKLGEIKKYIVFCDVCNKEILVKEREKQHPKKKSYHCSRSCANKKGAIAKANKYYNEKTSHYTTICWKNHEKKCIVCSEDKIVSVHHNDHNHKNNNPENLIPLCPTHHQYVHSKYKYEVQSIINEYIKEWKIKN